MKSLISEDVADVEFIKPLHKNKPEQICSTRIKEEYTAKSSEVRDEVSDIKVLLKAASILRKEIESTEKWTFEGSFANYKIPKKLYTFVKCILEGPRTDFQPSKVDEVQSKNAVSISQHIIKCFRTDRQAQYPKKTNAKTSYKRGETPLSLGLSLMIHQKTRGRY